MTARAETFLWLQQRAHSLLTALLHQCMNSKCRLRMRLILSACGFPDKAPGFSGERKELALSRSTNEWAHPLLKSVGGGSTLKGPAFKYQHITFCNYHLFQNDRIQRLKRLCKVVLVISGIDTEVFCRIKGPTRPYGCCSARGLIITYRNHISSSMAATWSWRSPGVSWNCSSTPSFSYQ